MCPAGEEEGGINFCSPIPYTDLLQSDHHVNSIHNESLRQLEFSRQSEGSSMGDSVTALRHSMPGIVCLAWYAWPELENVADMADISV